MEMILIWCLSCRFHRPFRTDFIWPPHQTLRVWLISSCACGTNAAPGAPGRRRGRGGFLLIKFLAGAKSGLKLFMKMLLICAIGIVAISTVAQNEGIGAFKMGGGIDIDSIAPVVDNPTWRRFGTNLLNAAYLTALHGTVDGKNSEVTFLRIKNPEKLVAVKNCEGDIMVGNKIWVRVLRDGIYQDGNDPLELWDCGEKTTRSEIQRKEMDDYRAEKLKQAEKQAEIERLQAHATAQRKAAAERRLWLDATNGVAAAQYQIGLRLLNGQGVETNRLAGLIWLHKAANQDNPQATEELKKLGAGQ